MYTSLIENFRLIVKTNISFDYFQPETAVTADAMDKETLSKKSD